MDDPRTQDLELSRVAREAARLIRQGLTQMGHCYWTRDGKLVEVSFASVQFVEDAYALVEVDTRRLPPRVSIPRIRARTRDRPVAAAAPFQPSSRLMAAMVEAQGT